MKNETMAPPVWGVIAAFAAVYVIWGSTYLGIRYAVESIPPFLMAGTRNLTAGLMLYAFARARGGATPSRVEWRDAAITGGLLLAVGNGGVTWAEQVIPSSVTALLVALTPLWMVLFDWLRPRGIRPRPFVVAGLAVGFVGVACWRVAMGTIPARPMVWAWWRCWPLPSVGRSARSSAGMHTNRRRRCWAWRCR